MRSIFAIWSDDGRIDYGTVRPSRLAGARRFGVAMVAVAVAGIGVWNAYTAVVAKPTMGDNSDVRDSANRNSTNRDSANRDSADANRDVANAASAPAINAGHPTSRSVAMKRRAQLRTIGLAPIGAPNRSTISEPGSVAGSAANAAITPVDRAQAAVPGDRSVAKLEENKNKLDEKSRVAKKKQTRRASVVQVYELPDGRRVVVRSRSGNDTRQADGADFDLSGNNFTTEPRFGRSIRVARPGLFGAPF